MKTRAREKRAQSSIRALPIGFAAMIAIGTALLMLPAATRDGAGLPFLSALFTATSASCVTGLIVVDTGTAFTLFGQCVILLLIQLGGLGFMTAAAILFVLIGKRISMSERITLAQSFGETQLQGAVRLGMLAARVTFCCEAAGAALLAIRFIPQFGALRGSFYAVFHAVSAFCNAGFDLMGGYASLTAYTGDPLVNFTVMALIVTGSLGFAVILDGFRKRRFRLLRLHGRIVLPATAALILGGAALVLLLEHGNAKTLGALPPAQRALAALFQSVTFRTAGFNTIDQASLTDATKLLGVLLMLVGGAPAGTAGGLKITTFMVMLYAVRAELRGRRDTEALNRRIPEATVRRALCLITIGLLLVTVGTMGVSLMERQTGVSFIDQLYEVVSALCTVGLSVGLTGAACAGTRVVLILLMFVGRVGMLTVALSLSARHRGDAPVRLPEEDILIG